MTPPVACRVCGSEHRWFLCTTPNEHSQTKILHHYSCKDCGSVYVGDLFRNEELGEAYASINEKDYYSEIESANRTKMSTAANRMTSLLPRDASIIDMGAGNGLFLRALAEQGFINLAAHEVPGHAAELRRYALQVYEDFDYASIPSNTFNCVTMLDVMEHVSSPRHTLEQAHRILTTDGWLYFHTPAVTSLDRMMHAIQRLPGIGKAGRIWQRGRTSVFHLQNYSPEGLRRLLVTTGFELVELTLRNELSWPLRHYIEVYLLRKQGLPLWPARFLTPLTAPVLATDAMNANKAVVLARRR
jgi:SAM-dependent methyltransferase